MNALQHQHGYEIYLHACCGIQNNEPCVQVAIPTEFFQCDYLFKKPFIFISLIRSLFGKMEFPIDKTEFPLIDS